LQNYEELCCYNCLSRLLLGMNVKLLGGTFYIRTFSKNSRSTFLLKSFSSLKTLSKAPFSFLKFAIKNTQCMQYSHERSKITIYTMFVYKNTIWSQNELCKYFCIWLYNTVLQENLIFRLRCFYLLQFFVRIPKVTYPSYNVHFYLQGHNTNSLIWLWSWIVL